MVRVSLIIPVYNEAGNLPLLRKRITQLIDSMADHEFEVLLVDDHSVDGTPGEIERWTRDDERVRSIRFSRNCGSNVACSAGLAACSGECAVLLAADLQDPPETIGSMIRRWRDGYDVVWAVRSKRKGERFMTRFLSRLYWRLMRKIATGAAPIQGADFVLVDRMVIDAYNGISERNVSLMAMLMWMGFRQTRISYTKQSRHAGKSKWTLAKKIKLAIDSVVCFSYFPVRLMSAIGILFAIGGVAMAATVLIGRLAGYVVAGTGYAAIMTVLLLGFGFLMLFLGILGEYLWRTLDEARGRPAYFIEKTLNLSAARRGVTGYSGARKSDVALRAEPERVGVSPGAYDSP